MVAARTAEDESERAARDWLSILIPHKKRSKGSLVKRTWELWRGKGGASDVGGGADSTEFTLEEREEIRIRTRATPTRSRRIFALRRLLLPLPLLLSLF